MTVIIELYASKVNRRTQTLEHFLDRCEMGKLCRFRLNGLGKGIHRDTGFSSANNWEAKKTPLLHRRCRATKLSRLSTKLAPIRSLNF